MNDDKVVILDDAFDEDAHEMARELADRAERARRPDVEVFRADVDELRPSRSLRRRGMLDLLLMAAATGADRAFESAVIPAPGARPRRDQSHPLDEVRGSIIRAGKRSMRGALTVAEAVARGVSVDCVRLRRAKRWCAIDPTGNGGAWTCCGRPVLEGALRKRRALTENAGCDECRKALAASRTAR